MFRAGMAAILSELARQGRMVVIDDLTIEAPKTKLFSQKLKSLGLEGNLLVITDTLNENLYLSSRNLPNVLVQHGLLHRLAFSVEDFQLLRNRPRLDRIVRRQKATSERRIANSPAGIYAWSKQKSKMERAHRPSESRSYFMK